jgi:hypothetical protein
MEYLGKVSRFAGQAFIPQQSDKQIALLSCIQSSPCRTVLCVSSRDGAVKAKAAYLRSRVRPLALFVDVTINYSFICSYSSVHISTIINEFALPALRSAQGNHYSKSGAASTSAIRRCGIHSRAVQIQHRNLVSDAWCGSDTASIEPATTEAIDKTKPVIVYKGNRQLYTAIKRAQAVK